MTSPKPALALRDASSSDLALINDIHVRSRRVAYRGHVSDHYLDITLPAASLEQWQQKLPGLLAGAGRVLVAEVDGSPIAFVCAHAPDAGGSVFIDNLHALPERKGLGAGTAMLEAIARWARANGARAMHLKVLETNTPAIGFYESLGWRCKDRVDETWGDTKIVALIYATPLT